MGVSICNEIMRVNGGIEADYVWHNNDTNQLKQQSCAFERVTPSERQSCEPAISQSGNSLDRITERRPCIP